MFAAGCMDSDTARTAVVVSTAASLRLPVEELAALCQEQSPDVEVIVRAGASGSLRRQIEVGDAADVFISANPRHMSALREAGMMMDESIRDWVTNRLVVIAPVESEATLASLEGLNAPEFARIAIGIPETAPVGEYAKAALTAVGIWDAIQPRLILGQNATSLAAYVQTGEVDAAILYATDLGTLGGGARRLLEIDPSLHPPIAYPMGITRRSEHLEDAESFVDFAFSERARDILNRHGFAIADGRDP
jgi:molybdate transport system substrate-binding protein